MQCVAVVESGESCRSSRLTEFISFNLIVSVCLSVQYNAVRLVMPSFFFTTSMSLLLIVRPKCTLAASHAVPG